MTRALCIVMASLFVAGVASARHSKSKTPKDPSEDFSKHFDDEVKYDRDHPKDDDGSAAPKKKTSSSHRSRKPKAPADKPLLPPDSL